MNRRYVDIDDVLDLFEIEDEDLYAKGTIEDALYDGTLKVYELPSAERHGRWIIYLVSPWDGEDVKCSVCGEKGCAPYWDYCPHCGSQMVDVVNEDDDTD